MDLAFVFEEPLPLSLKSLCHQRAYVIAIKKPLP
jgi:hypothetical protein